ncbi:amino acid ABC transporter permease [Pandoraea terrae]|uniref:Amino acid ABC transporter permease n=1 Tax=Pandoraea terrae TaxID=1537710 RepID=A0A5E4VJG8_9BURK|nr:amino acid ABC transporter permease [Pandoraea terrae]VVE12066.1 amino acid ABC transporter permease [Pandoraea terrae]
MSNNGLVRWCRVNLFASPFDTLLSVVFIPVTLAFGWRLGEWALTQAKWAIVADNLRVLMVGTFPGEYTGRAWFAASILAVMTGATLGLVARPRRLVLLAGAVVAAAVACLLAGLDRLSASLACLAAGILPWYVVSRFDAVLRTTTKALGPAWLAAVAAVGVALAPVGMEHWGGLLMSVLVTLLASVLSIPLGVFLAFGRRSRYASARVLCTGYIELMRSLPLILIVYWIWVVTPLLAPESPVPDLARGLVAFTLFFAAYVAEYVRSGLQSVPRGQTEAAASLGMSTAQTSRDVVLPQALRVVTPALVGNVLDIFNTVPLLFIIGLTDFLRAGQMVLVDPQANGRTYEIYLFMFAVYLTVSSLITYGARRLEFRMAAGHR